MSSARAEYFTPAGDFIGYGVYSGTSDVLAPAITRECDWAEGGWELLAACQHEGEEAIVYSDYGGGSYWPGRVCRECRIWKGELSPYPDQGWSYYNGPTPEEEAFYEKWKAEGWPKKGHPFPAWSPTDQPSPSGD